MIVMRARFHRSKNIYSGGKRGMCMWRANSFYEVFNLSILSFIDASVSTY